ncbi:MAG: 16S rRNA (guanine(966)-N(2))-methyltransferase RsmD [Deltaproteobacteria bacterium]|nr:MAG: 16S rRNA (guanine(966)-N(2))-methyltransferase RsmD [Deltaproteobacteria bacterium]
MRIIAGRFGGRHLKVPTGRDTRPTSDRVREALFSVIGDAVRGARVADLFAGTGALGLEALSRGAGAVDFYESGRPALAVLRANVAALGAQDEVRVVVAPLPRGLKAGPPWDLVLIDPPWGKQLAGPTLGHALAVGRLAPGGLVVVEERRGQQPPAAYWRELGLALEDERVYGDTTLQLLRVPDAG